MRIDKVSTVHVNLLLFCMYAFHKNNIYKHRSSQETYWLKVESLLDTLTHALYTKKYSLQDTWLSWYSLTMSNF
jgi:hypothetical protein